LTLRRLCRERSATVSGALPRGALRMGLWRLRSLGDRGGFSVERHGHFFVANESSGERRDGSFRYHLSMSTSLDWREISLRLLLTFIAGALIGFNRGEHGHPAGLRTTTLVCLAASLSMIQVNLLLAMQGRSSSSFVMLDLMRLPLGILSGMGFIGAGAILRRDDMIRGVTTAATLWFVTMMGLCFGGGQLMLGSVAFLLGMIVLSLFKWAEKRIPQDREALIKLEVGPDGPKDAEIISELQAAGFSLAKWSVVYLEQAQRRELTCVVRWRSRPLDALPPGIVEHLAHRTGVLRIEWGG
jgi:putative Mg2+ transporter-C (MgtC) family protein